jgi:hypothetical protein
MERLDGSPSKSLLDMTHEGVGKFVLHDQFGI